MDRSSSTLCTSISFQNRYCMKPCMYLNIHKKLMKAPCHLALLIQLGQEDHSKYFKPSQKNLLVDGLSVGNGKLLLNKLKPPPGGGRKKFIVKKGKKISKRESTMNCQWFLNILLVLAEYLHYFHFYLLISNTFAQHDV